MSKTLNWSILLPVDVSGRETNCVDPDQIQLNVAGSEVYTVCSDLSEYILQI